MRNHSGLMSSVTGDITLMATSFINQNDGAYPEIDQKEASLLLAGGTLHIDTHAFHNQALISARDSINIKADDLVQAGHLEAQNKAINLSSNGSLNNSGTIETNGAMILTAKANLNQTGRLVAGQSITIASENALPLDQASLVITHDIILEAKSIKQEGRIEAQNGVLTLKAEENLDNSGTALANTIQAKLGALNNSGTLLAQKRLDLHLIKKAQTASVINAKSGILKSNGAFILAADNLYNSGSLGSSDSDIEIKLNQDLNNTGLIYGAHTVTVQLDGTLTNTKGDIIAEENLTISGLNGAQALALNNISGFLEAKEGDMTVNAISLNNWREGDIKISTHPVDHYSKTSKSVYRELGVAWSKTTTTSITTTTTTITREQATLEGDAAQILTGHNLEANANEINNHYSLIAANGNINIIANKLHNQGRDLIKTIITDSISYHHLEPCTFLNPGCAFGGITDWTTHTPSTTKHLAYDAIYGTIEAGGTLTAQATGYIKNHAVRGGADKIDLSSDTKQLDKASASDLSIAGFDTAKPLISADQLQNMINALANHHALFEPTSSSDSLPSLALDNQETLANIETKITRTATPQAPFLLETRSDFIDLNKFLGSDYFLKKIGNYNPESPFKRLGDAYFEQRFISNQIFKLTGNHSLANFGIDTNTQIQILYDNAVEQQKALNLKIGAPLSPQQIKKLRKNIIWLETHLINGQKVLVPRVYLVQSSPKNSNLLASARLTGKDINLTTDRFTNNSVILSKDTLSIDAHNELLNTQGIIETKGDLLLSTKGLLVNRSGMIHGDRVYLQANEIINETIKQRLTSFKDFVYQSIDQSGSTAQLVADHDLTLNTSGNLSVEGGQLVSGGAMTLNTGGSAYFTALALNSQYENAQSRHHQRTELISGGDLTLKTGGALTFQGARLQTEGDAFIQAGTDLTLDAIHDTISTTKQEDHNSLLSHSSSSTNQFDETAHGTQLTAKGTVSINAKQQASIKGSNISAEKDITIAADSVTISAAQERHQTTIHSSKSGLFVGRDKDFISLWGQEHEDTDESTILSRGSDLNTRGNIHIIAQNGDITLQGSNLIAEKTIALNAKRNINITTSQETKTNEHHTNQSGFGLDFSHSNYSVTVGIGTKSTDMDTKTIQNNNSQSQLIAGKDINLDASQNAYLQAPQINAQGSVIVEALNEVTLATVSNQTLMTEQSTQSFTGLRTTLSNSALQNIDKASKATKRLDFSRAGEYKSNIGNLVDGAMEGYDLYNTYQQAKDVYNAYKTGQDPLANLRDSHGKLPSKDYTEPSWKDTFSVNTQLGFDQADYKQSVQEINPLVADLAAHGDLNIHAHKGQLQATGAELAATNINLQAGQDIHLASATHKRKGTQNATHTSASLGLETSIAGQSAKIQLINEKEETTTKTIEHKNAQINATNTLTIRSNGDTTLEGARVSGSTLNAEVGKNLNLISQTNALQTTIDSNTDTFAASVFLTGEGAQANMVRDQNQAIASSKNVDEQTSLQAGAGGFNIQVGQNTHLKGATITSKASKTHNHLTTGTLSYENIDNKASAQSTRTTRQLNLGGEVGQASLTTRLGYGAAKDALANSLGKSQAEESTQGHSKSAITETTLTITNETLQKERFNQTTTQTLADLNTNSKNSLEQATPVDIKSLQEKTKNNHDLTSDLLNRGFSYSDEAYHTMFVKDHPIAVLEVDENGKQIYQKDADGNPLINERGESVPAFRWLSEDERAHLKPGSDDKVHIFANGIFTDPRGAASLTKNTMEQTGTGADQPRYFIWFPNTNQPISEVMVAGYQKFLEGKLPLTNSGKTLTDLTYKFGFNQGGAPATGIDITAHSRGGMTTGNMVETTRHAPPPGTPNIAVNLFGSAYNAQKVQNNLNLINQTRGGSVHTSQATHRDDFVGRYIGGNPPTYGNQQKPNSALKEWGKIVTQHINPHMCYGSRGLNCKKKYGISYPFTVQ